MLELRRHILNTFNFIPYPKSSVISIIPQERNILLDEIIRRHSQHDNVVEDLSSDVQVLEAQRVRLTLLEEKIKEVLGILRSLNSMVKPTTTLWSTKNPASLQDISSKTHGRDSGSNSICTFQTCENVQPF